MLDIKFIRENIEVVKEAARKKRVEVDIDKLIALDDRRRELISSVEAKKAEQNQESEKIAHAQSPEERMYLINDMKTLKEKIQKEEETLKEVMKEWHEIMLRVPNIPDMSVPEGESEADNIEVEIWGEKPRFSFKPKDHVELMLKNDMVDFERGSKVHGFRGYFLKGDGALLSWALWNYAQEFYIKKGFEPFIAPAIVRKQYFYGTGHLPSEAEDIYHTQDDDYLAGTAEVPMMAYHSDEILKKEELPKKYLAFSPCFRREAGSYSKDTKGLIRVHEFYKIEQLVLCEASHGVSVALHEEINANFEEFLQSLGIPHRRLLISTGDLTLSKVKQYDTEAWIPSQNTYRELSSASYFHDFQTRRFNIRYDDGERKRYVHSLNNTAAATPRLLVALVENYQQEGGSIRVPEVLQKYMNKEVIKNFEEKIEKVAPTRALTPPQKGFESGENHVLES